MKYIDEFKDTEAITASGETTYSAWYDISWANELYAWLQFAESGSGDSEAIDVTLERETKGAYANQDVLTFTQILAAGTEEKYGSWMHDNAAPGAENKLGTRVRFKYVSSGTFEADNTITMTMHLVAVRR